MSFQSADVRRLPSRTARGGVLAWFSLIHLDPVDVRAVLAEVHRVLAPGGRILIGFFAVKVTNRCPLRIRWRRRGRGR
ncbi:class I SAM-dependent methyltransferase [Arthrobacter woluwensis]|uniref:class I SAM-dependent methyltransferase n=1 Tax=Arthrobacter woluwensis TaxID=156980 RepID=UPI00349ECD03